MIIVLALASLAFAGDVIVNGTRVDPLSLANMSLEQVDVTFDGSGNVLISAPGYEIEVVDPAPVAPPIQALRPAVPMAPPPQAAGGWNDPSAYGTAVNPFGKADAVAPADGGLGKGVWWLVTEDQQSSGHAVDVYLNGTLVKRVTSGHSQLIVDVGPWLHRGNNKVEIRSNSVNASGGTLYVYLGPAQESGGTVTMSAPKVQFGLSKSRAGAYSRTYPLIIE